VIRIDQPNGKMSSFEEEMRDFKIKLANRALMECRGNKTLAAQSMQISRAYLHRLIRGADDESQTASDQTHVA
jgi:hypothetical protein